MLYPKDINEDPEMTGYQEKKQSNKQLFWLEHKRVLVSQHVPRCSRQLHKQLLLEMHQVSETVMKQLCSKKVGVSLS